MADAAALEAIRRVEEAPLDQLVNISFEDVQAHMDALLEPGNDAASFFRRWETQQWAASTLDFERDRRDWANLPPPVQSGLRTTLLLFFVGEQLVADRLAPIVHAAPREDERNFLATQLADEARHSVFFTRFFEEVLGHRGGIHAALDGFDRVAREGYRRVLYEELPRVIDRCRLDPGDAVGFVEAVTTYHLVIEGYMALGSQRSVLRMLRRAGILPGFVAGFTAVTRDESRHIGFGALALRRRVLEDAEMGRVIARKVHDLLDPAIRSVVGPEDRVAYSHVSEVPEPMRIDLLDMRAFAIDALTRRLRAAGLADRVVAEVGDRMSGIYDGLWAEYERIHGVPHPVRHWQRLAGARSRE